jgi:Glycosyl hydrolases family 39
MRTVEFRCRLSETTGALPHFWEHTVGSGHAPLALRADWQEQLRRCHEELGFRHVRFHGLLCDDVGILVDERDRLLYSFFNADQIWDFLLSIGMKPFIELSFMPTTLASGGTTVFHYRGNVTPPKDYKQWATLIRKLVTHWVERGVFSVHGGSLAARVLTTSLVLASGVARSLTAIARIKSGTIAVFEGAPRGDMYASGTCCGHEWRQ